VEDDTIAVPRVGHRNDVGLTVVVEHGDVCDQPGIENGVRGAQVRDGALR
jgi:hypothetical protein